MDVARRPAEDEQIVAGADDRAFVHPLPPLHFTGRGVDTREERSVEAEQVTLPQDGWAVGAAQPLGRLCAPPVCTTTEDPSTSGDEPKP
jgi:hypothetical protein